MIVDTADNFNFSDEFRPSAFANGVAVIEKNEMYWVVSLDVTLPAFDPDKHAYCGFRCYRDLQGFLAIQGWTIKEVYTKPLSDETLPKPKKQNTKKTKP